MLLLFLIVTLFTPETCLRPNFDMVFRAFFSDLLCLADFEDSVIPTPEPPAEVASPLTPSSFSFDAYQVRK